MGIENLDQWNKFNYALKKNKLHLFWGPKTVQIELTNRCNFKCVMCDRWKWDLKNIPDKELSLEEIKILIKNLARNTSCKEIILSGGEPFLRTDIKKIIKEARNNNLQVSIFTNGFCLNDKMNDFLIKWNVGLCFSLDGCTAKTHNKIRGVNSFDKIMKQLNYFSKKKRNNLISINFVIQRDNFDEIKGLYELLLKKKIDYIRYGIVHGKNKLSLTKKQLKVVKKIVLGLIRNKQAKINLFISDYIFKDSDLKSSLPAEILFRKKPVNCYKVNNYSIIDAFGNVFPCTYAYFDNQDYDNFKGKRMVFSLGNIREKKFSKIWDSESYSKFRKMVMPVNIALLKEVCGQCEHYYEFKILEDSQKIFSRINKLSKKLDKPELYLYELEEKN